MTIVLSHKRAKVKCLSKIYHEILSKLWLSIQYITIEKITLYRRLCLIERREEKHMLEDWLLFWFHSIEGVLYAVGKIKKE